MIRITITHLLAALLLITATSCEKVIGEGPIRTETRSASNFTGIDMRMAGNVYYQQDPTYRLEVSAQQNVLDVLDTYVSNGTLVIKEKSGVNIRRAEDITVRAYGPSIHDLRLSGSGTIHADKVSGAGVSFNISGSGDINAATVSTDHVDATVSGSGNLHVDGGTTTSATLKISGSGGIDLIKVPAKTVNTSTSGSGTIKTDVAQKLNVTITGSGSVYYRGNPTISSHITGSGRVVPW